MNSYDLGMTYQVDPTTLLMERNIREAQPDPDLIASIKAVGVLEPVTAVLTATGELMVRFGHRRTLAACEAQLTAIPVYVTGADSQAAEDEIERVIAQRDENTHRLGLTTAEEVAVIGQLAAFGLSASQIAKKTRVSKTAVKAAQAIATSQAATTAAQTWEDVTLEDAAALAEFDGDTDALDRLARAHQRGNIAHEAQRLRDERDIEAIRRTAIEELQATGTTVLDRAPYYDEPAKRIGELYATSRDKKPYDDADAVAHADCPGHAVFVRVTRDEDTGEWSAHHVYYCTKVKASGHQTRDQRSRGLAPADQMTDAEREAAKANRNLIIENNKAWDSAQTVRRTWLAELATSKTAPKGTEHFIAAALGRDASLVITDKGNRLAAEWLHVQATNPYYGVDLTPAHTITNSHALNRTLVLILAGHETALHRGAWRGDGTDSSTGRYLRFLASIGYTLSDVEVFATSDQTA